MPFLIDPDRKFVFEYEIKEGDWIKVTFDFPYSEDVDYTQIRTLLKDLPEFKKNERLAKLRSGGTITKDEADILQESNTLRIYFNLLRKSLINCEGIGNKRTGKVMRIKDDDGKIIEANQLAVFEMVKKQDDLMEKVHLAYVGELDEGNLKLGLQQPSNSTGPQENVSDVTSQESVDPVST